MPNWLDPQRHPLRAGLFIEVAGGLLAVFVVFASNKVAVGDFLRKQFVVPLWLFVFLSTVALIAMALQIRIWTVAKPSKRIVIVIPALAQNHWFAELIQETFRQLHRHHYEVILKIPYENFSNNEQKRIFEYLERHPKEYAGGIIITHKHEDIRKEISELCKKISYPIVFADVRPFDSKSDYPENAAFIGYDEKKIGEVAARRVAKYLRGSAKDAPLVKVIGHAHSQTERQNTFCTELKRLIPKVDIDVETGGGFRRSKAKAIAVDFFKASLKDGRFVDAVFCTNDEMALGVFDAMLSVDTYGYDPPFLIGVDGSKGAIRLIQDKDAHLSATIKQPTQELSQKIVTLLNQKINHEFCPVETFLEPELYDKELAQAED